MTGHFQKKSIIFRDTREHQEHDTKNRLSIPGPSSEKLMAEIDELKKNRPNRTKMIPLVNFAIPSYNYIKILEFFVLLMVVQTQAILFLK